MREMRGIDWWRHAGGGSTDIFKQWRANTRNKTVPRIQLC